MPRSNPGRSLFAEQHLADRIAVERERRGLTYEALAQRMAEVGCPIQPSAIFKIEHAEPRRRITVDELVGFSQVFGEPMAELVADPAQTRTHKMTELHEQLLLQEATAATVHAAREAAEEVLRQLRRLDEESAASYDQLLEAAAEQVTTTTKPRKRSVEFRTSSLGELSYAFGR